MDSQTVMDFQLINRHMRNVGVQPMVGRVSGWSTYRSKMYKVYPDAFQLGQIKKKGRPRQYIVWVNGGPPRSRSVPRPSVASSF